MIYFSCRFASAWCINDTNVRCAVTNCTENLTLRKSNGNFLAGQLKTDLKKSSISSTQWQSDGTVRGVVDGVSRGVVTVL